MADRDTQMLGAPTTPQPAGATSQASIVNLVTVLQQMVRNQSAILLALQDIPGILAPTYFTNPWTPTVAFGGSSTGITYGVHTGTYFYLGNLVLCTFRVVLTSKGAQTGAATLGGLPVASSSDANNAGAGGLASKYANMASLTGAPIINVGASSSGVSLLGAGAAATAALDDTNFTNTTEIDGYFSYVR